VEREIANNEYSIRDNLCLEILFPKGKKQLASPLFVLESNNKNNHSTVNYYDLGREIYHIPSIINKNTIHSLEALL